MNDLTTFSNMPKPYVEQINACIANGKFPLSPDALVSLVKEKIRIKNGEAITPVDILEVLKTSVSAGIDPTSNDIFAFKSKGVLSVGISKKGWAKILDSRKGSCVYEYGPLVNGRTKVSPKVYEYVAATITRADGTIVTGPRVYADEFNSNTGAWVSNPKTMLTVRAFTQACALAYGIGAYDEDEAKEIYDRNCAPTIAQQAKETLALEHTPAENDLDLSAISTIDELNEKYRSLSQAQKKNPLIVNKFSSRKEQILASMENAHD